MKTLVVAAHNNEDVTWVKPLAFEGDWSVIVNSIYRPPGRESRAILQYVTDHALPDQEEVVFCQGNPFDHDPNFIRNLDNPEVIHFGTVHECDGNSGPAYEANLLSWCDVLGVSDQVFPVRFSAGSQYRVSGARIRYRSQAFYNSMLALTESNPKAPWVYERLWPIIWAINL